MGSLGRMINFLLVGTFAEKHPHHSAEYYSNIYVNLCCLTQDSNNTQNSTAHRTAPTPARSVRE